MNPTPPACFPTAPGALADGSPKGPSWRAAPGGSRGWWPLGTLLEGGPHGLSEGSPRGLSGTVARAFTGLPPAPVGP